MKQKPKLLEIKCLALCGRVYYDEIEIPAGTVSEKLYIDKEIHPALLLKIIK